LLYILCILLQPLSNLKWFRTNDWLYHFDILTLEAFFCDDALYKLTFPLHYITLLMYSNTADSPKWKQRYCSTLTELRRQKPNVTGVYRTAFFGTYRFRYTTKYPFRYKVQFGTCPFRYIQFRTFFNVKKLCVNSYANVVSLRKDDVSVSNVCVLRNLNCIHVTTLPLWNTTSTMYVSKSCKYRTQ